MHRSSLLFRQLVNVQGGEEVHGRSMERARISVIMEINRLGVRGVSTDLAL